MENKDSVPSEISRLMSSAWEARSHAYCPYSKFRVGAAVLCEDGTIYSGCNCENASYGLAVCAERIAVYKAVSEGHRKFSAIAVCCDVKGDFKASCGACRQVLAEFSLDWEFYMVKPDRTWQKVKFEGLLPLAFTPASLDEERDTEPVKTT